MRRLKACVFVIGSFAVLGLLSDCATVLVPVQAGTGAAVLALNADIARLSTAPRAPSLNDLSGRGETSWAEIPVYFGTRRNRTTTDSPESSYGTAEDSLKYGRATISIPEHYRPGREDTRGLCRVLIAFLRCKSGPTNTVSVVSVDEWPESLWVQRVVEQYSAGSLSTSPLTTPQIVGTPNVELMDEQKAQAFDALIYVHGFANSFADAVKRAAELSYDVGFPGVAFAYDWASRNSVPSYVVDQETAERSVPDFERFVRDVAVRTKARRIVIVAHSMGTRLVSYALRDLDQDPRLPIGPIIFAASDVDSAIFVDQFARSVARSGAPVTLYASSRDRVIRLSAGLVHADRRVGSGPPSLILFPRLDYVDASSVDTDLLGHGYFAENQALVNDLFLTIRHRFPAAMRNLHPVVVPAGTYYQPRGG